jgi:3-deoxy-D-manno-octulosonic-acid transferase
VRRLYTALFYVATPFILARLFWRGIKNPAYRRRIPERFGFYRSDQATAGSIWVHAVSVGEVESSIPLVRLLRQRHPDLPLIVTTTTPTGSDRVRALLADEVVHCYLPYDLPGCVQRFLHHFRPQISVILETEIWPNLIAACRRSSVPVLIVNGRLSERSVRGYRRLARFLRATLSDVTAIAAQSTEDADRFLAIGAPPERVTRCGNIKFDLDIPATSSDEARAARQRLFGDRPTLLAASTHSGEEQMLLPAFRALLARHPELLLILVPRHPERFADVAALSRDSGFSTVLHSQQRPCRPEDAVFVVDAMGELKRFYAMADVGFVGGSLVPIGGHNVLEPAAAGIPVIFGPYVQNFSDICARLCSAGGAIQCDDIATFTAYADELLRDEHRRAEIGARGREFVLANRGAVQRVTALVEHYLDSRSG